MLLLFLHYTLICSLDELYITECKELGDSVKIIVTLHRTKVQLQKSKLKS